MSARVTKLERPYPPASLLRGHERGFLSAPEVVDWIRSAIFDEKGPIHIPEHLHLVPADLCVLWTVAPNRRQRRMIVGTAEIPQLRGTPWVKARQEWQMIQWFGHVPELLITLSAEYSAEVDDASWCATVDHELCHFAHAIGENGYRYHKDGRPIYEIQGHTAEEHVGVLERWGVGAAASGVAQLVEAAQHPPRFAPAAIVGACGTCLARAA